MNLETDNNDLNVQRIKAGKIIDIIQEKNNERHCLMLKEPVMREL